MPRVASAKLNLQTRMGTDQTFGGREQWAIFGPSLPIYWRLAGISPDRGGTGSRSSSRRSAPPMRSRRDLLEPPWECRRLASFHFLGKVGAVEINKVDFCAAVARWHGERVIPRYLSEGTGRKPGIRQVNRWPLLENRDKHRTALDDADQPLGKCLVLLVDDRSHPGTHGRV